MSETDLNLIKADLPEKRAKKTKKREVSDSELQIKVNPWGFSFMIFAIAILAYLVIGIIAALPPFEYNQLDEEYVINDTLLVILLIFMLIFLGLGIYFVWFKKAPEKEPSEETGDESLAKEDQLTVVYIEDDIESEPVETKNEE